MKICSQCGKELLDDDRFCSRCGKSQGDAAPASAPATAQATLTGSGSMAQAGGTSAGESGVAVGGNVAGNVVIAKDGAQVFIGEQPIAMTAVQRESALGRYLTHIISRNRYLQLQGIRSGGKLVNIELESIYITLRATRTRTVQAKDDWLAREAQLSPGERIGKGDPAGRPDHVETVLVKVEQALAENPRLVVLGDPGSGKTTLLRYLALRYARDRAEGTTVVRDWLARPESGHLPLLVPLRNLGAYLKAHYPTPDGAEGHDRVLEFLRAYLKGERLAVPDDFFDRDLEGGRVALLLDGMDEVGDDALRQRVARLVEAFACAYPQCRVVVTSRVVGYAGAARLGEGFATTTVSDFTLADVAQFLTHWHRLIAVGQMGPGESAEHYAAAQTTQLMQAIKDNLRVRELAINPLMLTVIALVHRDRVKLPDRRAELYAEAVDVLLGKWDEARGVEETCILEGRPFDAGDRRLLLQSLALKMHAGGKREIEADDLQRELRAAFANMTPDARAAERAVERFIKVIQERTGLLVEAGPGAYRFSHLTFQEYLAALAMIARDDYVEYILQRAPEAGWREVILLAVGQLSAISNERTTKLIQRIADLKAEPAPYHNLVLAIDALRDAGSTRVESKAAVEIQGRVKRILERERPTWAKLFGALTAKGWLEEKGKLIEALARSGAGYWSAQYGEPEWLTISASEFWMGSEKGGSDERPVHRVYVAEFKTARVPITNAQYLLYVQATGATPPEHWRDGQPPRGQVSHPVVYVSWHDALKYCEWLSKVTGKPVRLPTEAEWEKAARGDQDKRAYPWGDDFDPARCNSSESGIGGTSPVGIYPTGASPYGALDMAGNVWEWCQSKKDAYPYSSEDGREELEGDAGRVVRGGSWLNYQDVARCACRSVGPPDYRYDIFGFRVVVVSPGSRS